MPSPTKTKTYEQPQRWEEAQGSLLERVTRVSHEAARVYAQQEAMLPTLHHDHTPDPTRTEHLQEVGRRVRILKENAKKPDKKTQKIAERLELQQRVIPSRFPEDEEEERGVGGETARVEGQLEVMLMDQEWDTRAWNPSKLQAAIETLYAEAEHSDDPQRRQLATTMLIRLLETREEAVTIVESTIPILMNKAFRSLTKMVDKVKVFRAATLLSTLGEWFAPVLSRDNAVNKCITFLLRETDLCARILQHHWRGVLFERSLRHREYDPSVRARLRSMHFIKNVELRHQFKVLRSVIGAGGLPIDAVHAYAKLLMHFVKPSTVMIENRRTHNALADQKRILASGILTYLASLIPHDRSVRSDLRRTITENVKIIAVELARVFQSEADKIIEIMKSNIIERVLWDLNQHLTQSWKDHVDTIRSSLEIIAAIASGVWRISSSSSSSVESAFLIKRLEFTATQFLVTPFVMRSLLSVLPVARAGGDHVICEQVLTILQHLSTSCGFKQLLDALTSNGGRALEQVFLCMEYDTAPTLVGAAESLFFEMTNHPDARGGFTTAGAVVMLSRWCTMGIENAKNPSRFVLALINIALLARQGHLTGASPEALCSSLGSLRGRTQALYRILYDLVKDESVFAQRSALYLHQTNVLQPILLRYLLQVTPSNMEPTHQNPTQRSISCIVLGHFFKVQTVAQACFSEDTVNHLALSLQCSRLDMVENRLSPSRSTEEERLLHHLGSKEACKALSRLARCPSHSVNLAMKPSLTSPNVPQFPQALICDALMRLHVLEDVLPIIHVPTDAAEFPDVDVKAVHAAVELIGYVRPMPYGEETRMRYLHAMATHPHGRFATEKLQMLIELAAPSILHVLREKNCGNDLVATCCSALSRLAATNACSSTLLSQGCLFTALIHLPEVLYDASKHIKPRQSIKSSPQRKPVPTIIDANVDDNGLLGVPASLFTLLGKLCAIAEGRAALMRALVLPRVLKRLQLTDTASSSQDLTVKSEIAVVIQRLAMLNAVEGNTSELFLHFRVLELLMELVRQETTRSVCQSISDEQTKWRVLDHFVGAIAALAQDVLVCVPKLVQLNVLAVVGGFIATDSVSSTASKSANDHEASLQYHTMSIIRAIASYPFGEYHGYLTGSKRGEAHFLDLVKKIGFNFKLELQQQAAVSIERMTIGELARETLALINERKSSHKRQKSRMDPVLPSSPQRSSRERTETLKSPVQLRKLEEALPTLPLSPKKDIADFQSPMTTPKSLESRRRGSSESLPPSLVSPAKQTPVSQQIAGRGGQSSNLNGVNLLGTRPPGPRKPAMDEQASANGDSPHYIFARPKHQPLDAKKKKKKTRDDTDAFAACLMLDPLFQPTHSSSPVQKQARNLKPVQREEDEINGYAYFHELDRLGHCVNVRARRSRQGDRYIPSLGQLYVEDATLNVLR